ncbi:MAG: hypothetical protein JWN48_4274 [Myxococcaceae bacterium]|nr:hypothetical protein [Myxococcaceae bacterium]
MVTPMRNLWVLARLTSLLCVVPACSDSGSDPGAGPGTEPDTSNVGGGSEMGSPGGALDAGTKKLDATVAPRPAADASLPTKADAATPRADAGGGGGDGPGKPAPSALKPKCVKKPSQVMVVGDSYINWVTHTFPQDMANEAKQTWRMEAIGAYSMGSGGVGLIGTQYDGSIMRDPDCHTILMDGGGNDVLVADSAIDPNRDCLTAKSATLPQCQTIIDKALAAADALLVKASAAGIRDVVYFFYPHVPEGTLLGGASPNTILDFALPQIRKFCDGVEAETKGKTRCTFVDMVPVFKGHDDWFFPGDIHETSAGSAAMAKEIWKVMKDRCIAQPSGSACCEE